MGFYSEFLFLSPTAIVLVNIQILSTEKHSEWGKRVEVMVLNFLKNCKSPCSSKQLVVLFLVIWHVIVFPSCYCYTGLESTVNRKSNRWLGQIRRLGVLKAHTGTTTLKHVKRVHQSYSFNVKFYCSCHTFSWPLLSKYNKILKFPFPTFLFLVILSWVKTCITQTKKFYLTQSFKYRT